MNRARLMIAISALTGQRIPISKTSAPRDTSDSEVLDVAGEPQMVVEKGKLRFQRNLTYATRKGAKGKPLALKLDLQSPIVPGRYPLIVYLTGGGFMVSPKQSALPQRTYVANHGFVVASIQYRTVRDGATYVDGVSDVKAAIRYLRANADEYQIDPAKVGVWGESAGGYLALMTGATNGEPEFEDGDESKVSSDVAAVVDKFGAADLSQLAAGLDDETVAANSAPANGTAKYLFGPATQKSVLEDTAAIGRANPINHLRANAPAFLFFHGIEDRIISPAQTQLPHQAVLAKKGTTTRYLLEGAGHGDLSVQGGDVVMWTTKRIMDILVDFFAAQLKK
ncbi:MAG TPA: alpha/beta hydrolase [Galbitalea sp.]|nr:alpha/beta hydrolase [Galbitalea sp.]